MLTKNYVLSIMLGLGFFSLTAQPEGDIINLGGEETAVGPLKPPPISQVAEPAAWLTSLLRGDSLRLTPGGMMVGHYFPEVSDNPGTISAYHEMNIFVFLEDQRAFQDYFMNRVYTIRKSSVSAGSRSKTRATLDQGRQAASRSRSATRSQNSLSTADASDNVNLKTYPLVRQYAVGQRSLAKNPSYLPKPTTNTGTIDAAYVNEYNRFTNLFELYSRALQNPSTKQIVDHPTTTPAYFFDASRRKLNIELQTVYDQLELAVKSRMRREYRTMYPGIIRSPTFQNGQWPESHVAEVTTRLSEIPIDKEQLKRIDDTAELLIKELRTLNLKQNELLSRYMKCHETLNEQERIWFKWLLRSNTAIMKDLSVAASYLTQVTEASPAATNYSQLVTAVNLLRVVRQRSINLPDEAKAREVLMNITKTYYQQVEASKVIYRQKRRG